MNTKRIHESCVVLCCLTLLIATPALADPPAALHLTDTHFLLDQTSQSNVLTHISVRDLDSNTVMHSSVSTQVLTRLSNYAWRAFPPLNYTTPIAASNELACAVDYLCGEISVTGSIGNGSAVVKSSHNSRNSTWIRALSCQTNTISCITTGPVSYMEYIDRLSQFLELQVGVMTNGDLIFGTAGNWPTNFTPQYTIELDVRYGQ